MQQLTALRRYWKLIAASLLFLYALYLFYQFFRRLKAPSTESVLMSLAAAANVWETYTLSNRKNGDSFSAVILKLGRVQTQIPFLYGQLGEHLFASDPITLEALRAGQAAGKYWKLLDKDDLQEAKK